MSYANEIMTAALESSIVRCKQLNSNAASGITDSKIGEVQVNIVAADTSNTTLARHYRKTWELDGKRIAAAKLEKALNEAAH